MPVRIGQEARKNLGLVSKSLQPTTYFRKIDVPGVITDRPGISDRGVVAPVTGIVTQIHAYPGNTVAPNAPLFSLRLVSESLHTGQPLSAVHDHNAVIHALRETTGALLDTTPPKHRHWIQRWMGQSA